MWRPGHEHFAGLDSLSCSSGYPTLKSSSGYSQTQTPLGQPFITGCSCQPLWVRGFAHCSVTENRHVGITCVDRHPRLFQNARGSMAGFKIYSCRADHKNSL